MKDIQTSHEIHVELADIEEITGKDYLWLFDAICAVCAHPFVIWHDDSENSWFDWTNDEEWVAGWKELREFFIDQGFYPGQIIWINVEE